VLPGTRLGPYEILSRLGAGGMGEVYRARDSRLNRDVAIKILPSNLAGDPERLARFTREAQTLASLNHPHIAHVHGLDESGPTHALVMELVEGDDLSAIIARGPVPLDEALAIAGQIADALAAAHESGIVHRDLKPANVKVRADGTVKVLDFGLAKALDQRAPPAAPSDPTYSPTITSPAMTAMGMILGTASYMSPEQARGRVVDRRADIWAFGCVLFEMLTGRRAFPGESVTDTLARVIEREPDWTSLPAATPAHVRGVLERCLRKDPARRLRDMGDVRMALDEGGAAAPAVAAVTGRRPAWHVPAGLAVTLLAGTALGWLARPAPMAGAAVTAPVQLDLLLPEGVDLFTLPGARLAISPDGTRIAFVAGGRGSRQVFVRALDGAQPVPVKGTDAAFAAVFSPDGQSLAFLSRDRSLKRVSLRDGLIIDIAPVAGTSAPLWGSDDRVVYAREGLWRVAAGGGTPERLTSLDTKRAELAHMPGVRLESGLVLFTSYATAERSFANNDGDTSRIEVVDPANLARRVVVDRAAAPIYSPTGHLLFLRDGAVLAVAVDAATAQVTGDAVTVLPAGTVLLSSGTPMVSLADNGMLVYAPASTGLSNLIRLTPGGAAVPLSETPRAFAQPRVSPDGTRLVVSLGAESLWVHDLSRDARTPLTSGRLPGVSFPIWSRDGRRVIYRRFDDLWWVDADGRGGTGRVEGNQPGDIAVAAAPDGDMLAVLRVNPSTGGDVFALSLSGAWPARPLVQTSGYDGGADFSPDGRTLIYASTDSGLSQVYLSPFPAMNRKWTVSTSGGTQPRWSRDGRQIFYRDGNRMMAVAVAASGDGVSLSPPRLLFDRAFSSGGYITIANYDVLPDGSFVLPEAVPGPSRLTVVLNWLDVLRRPR
jgi:Tol biopolymer transport system component